MTQPTLETIANLAKKRGFVYQASEIYGGIRSAYDYGPLGVELRNVKDEWWRDMVQLRDDVVGIDSPSSRPVRYGRRQGTRRCSPIRWSSVATATPAIVSTSWRTEHLPNLWEVGDIHRAQAISSHVPHPHGAG